MERMTVAIIAILVSLSPLVMAGEFFKLVPGPPPNHLIPVNPGEFEVRHILVASPMDIGLYLRNPSFGAQASLAIYTEDSTDRWPNEEEGPAKSPTYHATVMELNRNFRAVSKEPLIRKVYSAVIDRELAVSLDRLWSLFVLQTAYPQNEGSGLDGTAYYFSASIPGYESIEGQTWSPPKGTIPKDMVDFSEKFMGMIKSDERITDEERKSLLEDLSKLDKIITAQQACRAQAPAVPEIKSGDDEKTGPEQKLHH